MLISLDGQWRIAADPRNAGRQEQWWRGPVPEAVAIPVPWVIQAVLPGQHGVFWYWRSFLGPTHLHPEGRYLLRFWAVDYAAEVWLNGAAVGGHEGGETPFVLDATAALRPGQSNQLAVRVVNPTNEPIDAMVLVETPHRNKAVPHYTGGSYNYGGILESVELLGVPCAWVEDLFLRPDPRTGRIQARVALRQATDRSLTGRLRVTATPSASGETVAESELPVALPPGVTGAEAVLPVDQPRLWDLHDPFLYRVTATLELDAVPARHQAAARCGFRDFRVEAGYFRLNGRRVFVRSSHTGNHCPVGQVVPPASAPDLLRRDLVYAKASGFNMIRFIAGIAHPWQLDACDEIGLMVYEESLAGWCLADSPAMGERFDRSTAEMIRRDRNHPSVVIWGLLNETADGPVYRRARSSLPLVRDLDDTRLVLLGSGRWDGEWATGSVSNPGSRDWEHVWGSEAPDAAPSQGTGLPGYKPQAGDAHIYPSVPQTPETDAVFRRLGHDAKPVFLSEYGIGSLMHALRELRHYEQSGENLEAEDAVLMRSMAERLLADWQRYGMDGVYPFPEDMLTHSQQLHGRQRLVGFDLIRANPRICGYNLTGLLDHGMTGEGLWRFWREWKPGIVDALADGWAPLRWCLFAQPLHGYAGQRLSLEVVLADEDVLRPGDYPVHARLMGPEGVAWERRTRLRIAAPDPGSERPLAWPVLREEVELSGPAGVYELAVTVERGAAPAGGRLRFHRSDAADQPRLRRPVVLWGVEPGVEAWLRGRGVDCRPFSEVADHRQAILVGQADELAGDAAGWQELARRMARGSVVVFASPAAFRRRLDAKPDEADSLGWLPLADKGGCPELWDWLYHKECVAKPHPAFAGMPGRGIMDWDYYGPVIPKRWFTGQGDPGQVAAAGFAVGYPCPGGYVSGVLLSEHPFGRGRFLLSTMRLLENLGTHPAADRMLLNLLDHAGRQARGRAAAPPADLAAHLRAIGYLP